MLRPAAILSSAALTLLSGACGDGASSADGPDAVSGDVVVFAAASLTEVFTDIGDAFTAAHPEADVVFNFAASSELATQIVEGAPADVYASADVQNMDRLTAEVSTGEPRIFATNVSEIVVEDGNPLGITGVEDLADPGLVLVACAPQVPCGRYAMSIFESAGSDVTPDSYEQNVKAVVTKVALGEADVGISYATDVAAAGDDVDGVEIPPEHNPLARYPIVATTAGSNDAGGRAFTELVLGETGRRLLADHGFGVP